MLLDVNFTALLRNDITQEKLADFAEEFNSEALMRMLENDWLQQNISRTLNISAENLTNLSQSQNAQKQYEPLPLLTTLTVFYALIFIAGILGNLITCIVISRNKFMHTATNFYLFNLAVSDLILLVSGMPQEVYNLWYPDSYPFTDFFCILESVLSETAANATVLTITAFTVERYIAICHPFRQHTMSKLSRAIKFIFAIWMAACLLALPQAMQFSVETENGGTSCTMNNYLFKHVFAVSGFIFFGGPMTAICVLYVLIGVKLKRSRLLQTVPRRCFDMNRGISAQSRVIRMLVAVAVAFFLCWAPFHAQRLMAVYGTIGSKIFNDIFYILNYISGVLYFLSTCINPLLYNIMSHKFREAFKVTLARHFGLTSRSQGQSHNYCAIMRQNGSMRLHTTVNNNLSSFRVPLHNFRDPNHHLSLQDSLRTTMTTTTSGSGSGSGSGNGTGNNNGIQTNGGNNSCRNSMHRTRAISMGSQSALNRSLSKNDVFFNGHGSTNGVGDSLPHRKLQKQISQLSSLGDANSLLEAEDVNMQYSTHHAPPNRRMDLRRSIINNATKQHNPDDCTSLDSRHWDQEEDVELRQRRSDEETDLFPKPVAPLAPLVARQPLCITPMHSVAELQAPTRSRLKLSRIITRRNHDIYEIQSSPRVELMRSHSAGMTNLEQYCSPLNSKQQQNKHKLSSPSKDDNSAVVMKRYHRNKPHKRLDNLVERFRWRTRAHQKNNNGDRKQEVLINATTNVLINPTTNGHLRQESNSSISSNSATTPTNERTDIPKNWTIYQTTKPL